MRSLDSLPKQVSENRSVYLHEGYSLYGYLGNLVNDNGTLQNTEFDPYSDNNDNFTYFIANADTETAKVYVNDVRLYDGSAFGANLVSSPQLISGNKSVIKVRLNSPVSLESIKRGYGIAFKREVYKNNALVKTTNLPHVVIVGAVDSNIPQDAMIDELIISIASSVRKTRTPPLNYSIFCLYSIYTQYEFSSDMFKLSGSNHDDGFLEIGGYKFITENVNKKYQYMVYDRGQFLGELDEVVSTPSLRLALNSFPSEITVDIAKDASSDSQEIDGLLVIDNGDPEPAIDNEYTTINVTGDTKSSYGNGTMININNDVDVYEYNGHYEGIELDDGEPLLLNETDRLITPIGSPEGKLYFSGYVSKYDVEYKKDHKGLARMTLLSHADELNNIVLSAMPTPFAENSSIENELYLKLGVLPQSVDDRVFNFVRIEYRPENIEKLNSVQVKCYRKGGDYDNPSSFPDAMVIITENNTDPRHAPVIAKTSAKVQKNKPYWQSFAFDNQIELLPNHTYYIYFAVVTFSVGWTVAVCSANQNFHGGYWNYSRNSWGTGIGLGDGGQGDVNFVQTSNAMQIKLMNSGGETLIPMYSKDPSEMFKSVIDYGKNLGTKIGYTKNSITKSGTVVTAKFNMDTLKEALDAIINYEPTDWYWYLDQSDLNVYLNPKSESVTHWLTLHKDVEELKLEHSMESLVNEVYFTGGKASYNPPEGNLNKNYVGGADNNRVVCSQLFKPEADTVYRIFGDVESKSTYLKIYKYYNNSQTPIITDVPESKNGELSFTYSSTNDSKLTGICIACRTERNDVLAPSKVKFSVESEQNIYRHLVNKDSQNKYRRAVVKKTDQRVTNNLSADIIADGELARNNEPIFAGTVRVLRDEHYEMINPGSLIGFRNFGNYIDGLKLLVMEVTIEQDILELSLGAFVPKTSKRLEDIKRNLAILENQMNPVSPTGGK